MKFLSFEQFKEMWELQDSLNSQTSGMNWPQLEQNWNLAIKAEVMEFFDYIGWKWWKEPEKTKKCTDLQARLELVDIWHFLLSTIIQSEVIIGKTESDDKLAYADLEKFLEGFEPVDPKVTVLMNLDSPRCSNLQKVAMLSMALQLCEWTWDDLYTWYIAKNVLNKFRQDHGYKEGTYQKIWDRKGREDNFYLEQIVDTLVIHGEFSQRALVDCLANCYNFDHLG